MSDLDRLNEPLKAFKRIDNEMDAPEDWVTVEEALNAYRDYLADPVAAAANLDGAEIIPRCAEHGVEWVNGDMSWNNPGCWWARAVYVGVEDCRMVREVRIPVPDKEWWWRRDDRPTRRRLKYLSKNT